MIGAARRSKLLPAIVLLMVLVSPKPASAQFGAGQNDWVSMWALNGRTEQQVSKQFRSDLKMRITNMDRVCDLNQQQEQKLRLAAEADITRFLRDCARIRAKLKDMNIGNNNVQEAWQVVSPLATRVQTGMFGDGSLFQKVLKSNLNDSQQALHNAELEKNRKRRWRAVTRVNLAEIEKSVPLLGEQREKLLELMDAVEVPLKISRHMDGYVGYLRLIKVDEKKMAKFLDTHQIAAIEQYRQRYQGWGNMFQ